MSLLQRLFPKRGTQTASVAKERLQIVIQQARKNRLAPDFLPELEREILAVVAKYIEVSDDMIKIQLEKSGDLSILEINVELDKGKIKPRKPEPAPASKKPPADGLVAEPA